MNQRCSTLINRLDDHSDDPALSFMKRYDPDNPHALQVERLAGLLFDLLASVHGMGEPEKRLLLLASLLHDTGWSVPSRPHHKASMDLILADTTIPLTPVDRQVVALIARYHRKADPDPSHSSFAKITDEEKRQVRWSAGILRLADALDSQHKSAVQELSVHTNGRVIQIDCKTTDDHIPEPETRVLEKKSTLLSEMTGCRIEILWSQTNTK
jgi:exopolyphosphatase/pppGpp-phosphohydrolase